MPSAPLPPPRDPALPYRVCLVCLGNICRSPMAETVLRDGLARAGLDGAVEVDSAGTGDWHVGGPMNPSARAALARRGYDGSAHRARQYERSWLAQHDLLLAMDASNLATLRRLAGAVDGARIRLFAEVAGGDGDIPDPYGGSAAEFDHVLDLLAAATPVIVDRLAQLLDPPAPHGSGAAGPGGPAVPGASGPARPGASSSGPGAGG
jgi:protein-tyrosine phosphatase